MFHKLESFGQDRFGFEEAYKFEKDGQKMKFDLFSLYEFPSHMTQNKYYHSLWNVLKKPPRIKMMTNPVTEFVWSTWAGYRVRIPRNIFEWVNDHYGPDYLKPNTAWHWWKTPSCFAFHLKGVTEERITHFLAGNVGDAILGKCFTDQSHGRVG